jgi:hypothetical protein
MEDPTERQVYSRTVGLVVAVATVFAIVVTKSVDLIRNLVGKAVTAPKWVWNVCALGLGIAMAVVWRVNTLDNYSSSTSVV